MTPDPADQTTGDRPMPSIPAADAATLAALVRHHESADLRAHAAALRDRLAELDAQHRDRTQSLRDDLRRVEVMLLQRADQVKCESVTGRLGPDGVVTVDAVFQWGGTVTADPIPS